MNTSAPSDGYNSKQPRIGTNQHESETDRFCFIRVNSCQFVVVFFFKPQTT
jgi:hypothetical protein